MSLLKDCLEIIYYIAFIFLTTLIVAYAKKTYLFQTDKSIKLFCKIYVDDKSNHKYGFRFGIEIFNYGNAVAENIVVELFQKQITTVEFIKPNESYYFPLGTVTQTLGGNFIYLDTLNGKINPEEFDVKLYFAEKVSNDPVQFKLNAGLLYAYRSEVEGSLEDVSREISRASRNICDSIDRNKLITTK